jgi:chromate transport protein ChrA
MMIGLKRAHVAVGSASEAGERVSLVALFIASFRVSLLGFGGGLVWARRIVVQQQWWTGDEELTHILILGQFMPVPNIKASRSVSERNYGD